MAQYVVVVVVAVVVYGDGDSRKGRAGVAQWVLETDRRAIRRQEQVSIQNE